MSDSSLLSSEASLSSSPANTDVFKTSSGRLKKATTSYDQTRRSQGVWRKLSYLRRPEDVGFTSPWRRQVCDVLKTSILWCLEDVWFTMSSRRLIYDVFNTSNLLRLQDVWFTTSWRRVIYDVLRTSVEQRLCSNVVATSTQRRNKWFFLILYCLKYSESFKCFCLDWYLGMKFCKLLRFFNHTCKQILQNH